jgi:hypothetical protein
MAWGHSFLFTFCLALHALWLHLEGLQWELCHPRPPWVGGKGLLVGKSGFCSSKVNPAAPSPHPQAEGWGGTLVSSATASTSLELAGGQVLQSVS